MKEQLTISKTVDPSLGPDYNTLRAEGFEHITALASALWSDHNVHDPGITTMEMLCYVLTDLNFRISQPVENIVAVEENNIDNMHRQFLSAIKILPNYPVTADDYRQLFVRLDGVRNAWITISEHTIVANYKQADGHPLLHYKKAGEVIKAGEEIEFTLKGINDILLDFEEFPDIANDPVKLKAKQDAIIKDVRSVYHYFRQLCEDLNKIKAVESQEIVICAEIELQPDAEPEVVWADIVFATEQYLTPDINFYSLQELLDKDMQPDEIFEGPVFDFEQLKGIDATFTKQGFIIPSELAASQLRTEVRLSDLYRIIMNIEGVKLVKHISFGFCGCDEKPAEVAKKIYNSDTWLLCVDPGRKPVLCETNSSFTFYKDVIPLELDKDDAKINLKKLRDEWEDNVESKKTEDLPMPEGEYENLAHYETFQNQFPENYGISPVGLPATATEERKALALQLKAYLLFFDQVIANYFSQLANAKTLLTADDAVRRSYFNNIVEGIRDDDKILDDSTLWLQTVNEVMSDASLDNYAERKNKFLDHLLARFAEQFNEYVFLMYRIYGSDYKRNIIRHKVAFLKEYDQVSVTRGAGMDLYNNKTAQEKALNVSGMEKRISGMLGFTNYKRQPLTPEDYLLFKPDATHYNWSVSKSAQVIFKGLGTYAKEISAYEDLGLVSVLACDRENYVLKDGPTAGKKIYDIANSQGDKLTANDMEIDVATIETELDMIIKFMREDFKMEGMYVIENMLLRPPFSYTGDTSLQHQFMPVCIEPNGEYCKPLDPYSYRISVILPGYSPRLRNTAFRTFAERLIRMETPAHVLPRICFIGRDQMVAFETLYKKWLEKKLVSVRTGNAMDVQLNNDFIALLEDLYTVYLQGELSDCDDDNTTANPIILNKSILGSLENTNE
jgi:hypothetical protein